MPDLPVKWMRHHFIGQLSPLSLYNLQLLQAVQFMMIVLLKSGRFAKREVYAISAHKGVVAFFERHDAVIVKSGRSAPNHHITVSYIHTPRFVSSL